MWRLLNGKLMDVEFLKIIKRSTVNGCEETPLNWTSNAICLHVSEVKFIPPRGKHKAAGQHPATAWSLLESSYETSDIHRGKNDSDKPARGKLWIRAHSLFFTKCEPNTSHCIIIVINFKFKWIIYSPLYSIANIQLLLQSNSRLVGVGVTTTECKAAGGWCSLKQPKSQAFGSESCQEVHFNPDHVSQPAGHGGEKTTQLQKSPPKQIKTMSSGVHVKDTNKPQVYAALKSLSSFTLVIPSSHKFTFEG